MTVKGKSEILGSSLFFTCARDYFDKWEEHDNDIQIVDVHLIDMGHMELFDTDDQRDWGFIKGLEESIKLLTKIRDL